MLNENTFTLPGTGWIFLSATGGEPWVNSAEIERIYHVAITSPATIRETRPGQRRMKSNFISGFLSK